MFRSAATALFALPCAAAVLLSAAAAHAQWQSIGTGFDYREFSVAGPNTVYVSRMTRSEPTAIVDTAVATDSMVSGREPTADTANRMEGAFGYWGGAWGSHTYDVVAAVNGSYHDTTTGMPEGGMIISGWHAKRHLDFGGESGFAWKADRELFMGGCVHYRGEKNFVTFDASSATVTIDDVNQPRGSDALVLYTIHYDWNTNTDGNGIEVLVRMDGPAMVMPEPAGSTGTIVAVRDGQGSTPVPFDHVVLSASGSFADDVRAHAAVGGTIHLSQELSNYEKDCNTPANDDDWTRTYASIEGAVHMVHDGQLQPYADAAVRARTAVAFDDDYLYFVVVDEISGSVGMTFNTLGQFCLNELGVVEAISVDGGGSSTMVLDGQVMNHPSDGAPRSVANAILMISLQPATHSSSFTTDTVVEAAVGAERRLGPGEPYHVVSTVSAATQGTVLAHEANGIESRGGPWWLVDIGGEPGWFDESELTYISGPVGPDGGAGGVGGSASGGGSTEGGNTGTGGAGASAASGASGISPSDDDGCGCRLERQATGRSSHGAASLWLAAAGVALARRRRCWSSHDPRARHRIGPQRSDADLPAG